MNASHCAEVRFAEVAHLISPLMRDQGGLYDEIRWWIPTSRPAGEVVHDILRRSSRIGSIELGGDSTTPSAHRLTRDRLTPLDISEGPASGVRHLRERSGLTWEQLARAMQVDKRSLHHWAAGAAMSALNHERLQRLIALVDFIDRGFIDQTYRALLSPTPDGRIALDWLAEGRDDAVKRLLGQGRGPQHGGSLLSPEERKRRRPPPPAILMDARHDVQPVSVGQRRVVRKLRGPV